MNYSLSVIFLCLFYSLSVVSSERDAQTDEQTTKSPRLRALTPYTSSPDKTTDHDDNGFCVLSASSNPLEISENGKPAYPESPQTSPITLNTVRGHRRDLSQHSESGLERSDIPSSPRHRPSPKTRPNRPESGQAILRLLQEQRKRDGIPVTACIEKSLAVKKEPTTPTSNTLSQLPPSMISTFAGATQSVLTQRRNSGSPKNHLPEKALNVGTNVQEAIPNPSAAVANTAPHSYQRNETLSENNPTQQALPQTDRPLTKVKQPLGYNFVVAVDLERKTNLDHVVAIDIPIKPRNRSCFEKLCCCLPQKTKNR